MSAWLIAAVGFVYLGVAVEQFLEGNPAMGIVFFCYAGANVGLYLMAR